MCSNFHNAQVRGLSGQNNIALNYIVCQCPDHVEWAKFEVDKPLGQQEDIRVRQPGLELDMVQSAVVDRQPSD